MRRRPTLFVLVALCAACASRLAVPPEASPMMRAAQADTAAASRVYSAAEVAKPVMTAPGNPSFELGSRDGRAVLRFVVDTLGRVEVGTAETVPGSDSEIAARTAAALPRIHYWPARLESGRKVRQLVELGVTKRGTSVFLRLSTDPL